VVSPQRKHFTPLGWLYTEANYFSQSDVGFHQDQPMILAGATTVVV